MSANFLNLPSELRNRKLTPGLLRANKTVHRKASSLFYAQNRFNFTMATPEDVASFLGTIGRNYADYIQHICVNFLNLRDLKTGTNAMELRLDALDNPMIVTGVSTLVDTRFKAISSLQEIIVKVYEDGPSDYIRRKMESHGWTVSATEYIEEWGSDRSFGDFEDDWDHDCGYDDNDVAYDIDNDSDF